MIVDTMEAARLIKSGRNVAIPTETVYGLAADATNAIAVRNTFRLKKRPADNPLIVHLSGTDQIKLFSDADPALYRKLTATFWPGPLTLILQRKNSVLDIITAGLDTVALRMPDHPKALEIIGRAGPVTAPSANVSGRPSPTKPAHVIEDFGDEVPVVDGGECRVGIESTVLDLTHSEPVILRPGQLSADEISRCIGRPVTAGMKHPSQSLKSPGTRYTHYTPKAVVRWMTDSTRYKPSESAFYIFHTAEPETSGKDQNLVHFHGEFHKMARALYDLYRTADQHKFSEIWIEPLPSTTSHPILPALQDRIERSAAQ